MEKLRFEDLEQDAILELINIGIGNAASALSQMTNEEVILSVPDFEFVYYDGLVKYLEGIDNNQPSGVSQHFSGDFSGTALLLFPESSGMSLVREMLKDTVDDEHFSELEAEAMVEIGNIILNACFGQLGDILSTEFDSHIPTFIRAQPEEIIASASTDKDSIAMLLQVDFSLVNSKTKGFVMFIMDSISLDIFRGKVKDYLSNALGGFDE